MQLQSPWITAAVSGLDRPYYADHHDDHHEEVSVAVARLAAVSLAAAALEADLDQFHIHHLLLSPPISELACRHLRIDRPPADESELSEELSLEHGETDLTGQPPVVLQSFPSLYFLFVPDSLHHLRHDFRQEAAYFLDPQSVEPE